MADNAGGGGAGGTAGGVAAGGAGGAGLGAGQAAGAGAGAGAGAAGAPDLAALQAELAALKAERDAEKAGRDAERAAATSAAEKAAAAAEAERQAKLTEAQRVQEELTKQRGELEATKTQLVNDRRTLALERLGVAEKFRAFAPAVDPADPKGAKQLEEWAKANPELLAPMSRSTTGSTALDAIRSGASTALQQVLAGTRKSTLVTARNLGKLQ